MHASKSNPNISTGVAPHVAQRSVSRSGLGFLDFLGFFQAPLCV